MKIGRNKLLYTALLTIFLPFIVLFLYTFLSPKTTPIDGGLKSLTFVGEYSYDNKIWKPLHSQTFEGNNKLILKGHFQQDIQVNEEVWFHIDNCEVKLIVNNKSFDFKNSKPPFNFFKSSGDRWESFKSPHISIHDQVQIEITPYYNTQLSLQNLLNHIYTGNSHQMYSYVFNQFDIFTLIAFFTMVAGWIYMLEGLIYELHKVNGGKRIALLGFHFFAGGLWCATYAFYPYLSLLIPPWIIQIMNILAPLLFLISIVMVVHYYIRNDKAQRIMNVIVLTTAIYMCISVIVQLTGLSDFYHQQIYFYCLSFILLVFSLICIWIDLKNYKNNHLKLLFLGLIPTCLSMALDASNIFFNYFPEINFIQYGFSLSAILMISQLISYANMEKETQAKIQTMKEELLESRISIMLSQIQPHFLYNALESIGDLCTKNPDKAEQAITDFSLFLRGNLDSLSSKEPIPFEQELSHTQYYLDLEKLRFQNRLNVKINTPIILFRLPCLTLQPIVENAVRYGITKKKEGGTIFINTAENETSFIITVRDDGIGFDDINPKQPGRSHIGINNVRERLNVICHGEIIIDSVGGKGTTVTIVIPKEEQI